MCCICGGGSTGGSDDGTNPDENNDIVNTCETHDSTDDGATDPYGDSCATYADHPEWCGEYNDDDFNSMEMCC